MWSFILFSLGLFVVIKAADYLIDGASAISAKYNISHMVIGLTVVAFGTSAPELFISITSALEGDTQIALGNAVGSNITNTLLILGASASVYPLILRRKTTWREVPMSLLAAIVLVILGTSSIFGTSIFSPILLNSQAVIGRLTSTGGLALLGFFLVFMYYTFNDMRNGDGENDVKIPHISMKRALTFMAIGLIGLPIGSKLTVDNAIVIANTLNVSSSLISLTLIAFGTSLPELVTSISAAFKKSTDLAVGNIMGSNIFNIFFVLGITTLLKPIPITGQNLADMYILGAATIITFLAILFHKRHEITRKEGIILLAFYLLYLVFIVQRG